jgi:cobalt-zinc-cadmium resistance protein CzcA
MLGAIVDTALRQRLLVIVAAIGLAIWGAQSYRALPIDAFPDVSPTQVLVSMRAPGLTPEELERRVTQPVELAMRGIPSLVFMRSVTRFSVTLMTFEFAPGTDIFWAARQVNERLSELDDQLASRRVGRPRAHHHAAGRDADVHPRRARACRRATARTLLDWVVRPQLARRAGRGRRQRAGRLRAHLRGGARPGAMAARAITTVMLERPSSATTATTAPAASATARKRLLVRAEGRIQTLEDVRAIVLASASNGGGARGRRRRRALRRACPATAW